MQSSRVREVHIYLQVAGRVGLTNSGCQGRQSVHVARISTTAMHVASHQNGVDGVPPS